MWGQIAMAGMQVAGGLMGRKSGLSPKLMRRRGRSILNNQIRPQNKLFLGQAEKQFKGQEATVRGGYQKARQSVSGAMTGAKVQTADAGKRMIGDVKQGMEDAGFSAASSIMQNAKQGVGAQTSRALADLESRMGEIMASLDVGEGEAAAGAQSRYGSFLMDRLRAEQIPSMMEYELLTGVGSTGVAGDFDLSGLGVLAGQLGDIFGGDSNPGGDVVPGRL